MTAIASDTRIYATVVELLDDVAKRYADREALVVGATRLTYREYASCIAAFAEQLLVNNIRGERVAILLPNSAEICIATFAVHAAGAQVVPLNPLYTERELEAILADAAPRLVIVERARAEALQPLFTRLGVEYLALEVGAAETLAARDANRPLPQPLPSPDDLAFVQYTGGTTGRSKGVMLTHRAVAVNISQRESTLPLPIREHEAERILCVMPLFHTYALSMGLHLAAFCAGTLVVLPRYHPHEVLTAIATERITVFPGSPTIYIGLMGHPSFASTDFSTLHTCYSGSAALPLETLRRWEQALGCRVFEGYGQTEGGPILSFNPARGERKPGTVGIALAETEIQIVDVETGRRVLGAGERGEIRARGPQIMTGYRNLPAETSEALRDGWLYTGDIGELDADGYLTIRDRKKDMVIVGGYNVYPREVEDVLMLHPAVAEAAVVGAPDSYRGECVRAYVTTRSTVSADELRAHCERNLARYKVPATIDLLDAMPKTTVNKTDKKALRTRAAQTEPHPLDTATSKKAMNDQTETITPAPPTADESTAAHPVSVPNAESAAPAAPASTSNASSSAAAHPSTLRERLSQSDAPGELRDGDTRYVLLRADALMGLFKHLPPVARAEAFAAMARSVYEHVGKTAHGLLGQGVRGHDRYLQRVVELANELGWGDWRFMSHDDKKVVLEVTGSPFAAGFDKSGTPVCAPIVGLLRAVAGHVFGRQATATESTCTAHGGEICRFEAQPLHIGSKAAAAAAAAAESEGKAEQDAKA